MCSTAHAGRRLGLRSGPPPARRVLERFGPAVGAGDHLHAVGAQRVQLAHATVDRDRFDVCVTRHQQIAVPASRKSRRVWSCLGPRMRSSSGCASISCIALVEQQRDRRRGFGDHPHRPIDDRVLHDSLRAQRSDSRAVTRRVAPARLERDQARRCASPSSSPGARRCRQTRMGETHAAAPPSGERADPCIGPWCILQIAFTRMTKPTRRRPAPRQRSAGANQKLRRQAAGPRKRSRKAHF